MCTVSFVSAAGRKIITSNRDEHIDRPVATAPVTEKINGQLLTFPKDPKAGGTWFAVSDEGVIGVLLNGAFAKHLPAPPYRRSRGLILLDIMAGTDASETFSSINLEQVEPFTLIHYRFGQLHEWRWDGKAKHQLQLDASASYIWSSATLYPDEVVQYRKRLFGRFLEQIPEPDPSAVYAFHASNNNDPENGFVINRSTGMQTFSITQAVHEDRQVRFLHTDLRHQQQYEHRIFTEQQPITPS